RKSRRCLVHRRTRVIACIALHKTIQKLVRYLRKLHIPLAEGVKWCFEPHTGCHQRKANSSGKLFSAVDIGE
ncbi:hypothetical protein RvY_08283, partial [Ramazzottius varieornatus]